VNEFSCFSTTQAAAKRSRVEQSWQVTKPVPTLCSLKLQYVKIKLKYRVFSLYVTASNNILSFIFLLSFLTFSFLLQFLVYFSLFLSFTICRFCHLYLTRLFFQLVNFNFLKLSNFTVDQDSSAVQSMGLSRSNTRFKFHLTHRIILFCCPVLAEALQWANTPSRGSYKCRKRFGNFLQKGQAL
jgi:hypothetical protein